MRTEPTPVHHSAQELFDAWIRQEPVLTLEMAPNTFPMLEQQIQAAAFDYLGAMLLYGDTRPASPRGLEFDNFLAAVSQHSGLAEQLTPLQKEHALWLATNWCYGGGSAPLIQKAIERDEGERVLSVRRPLVAGPTLVEIDRHPMQGPPTSFTPEAALEVVDHAIAMEYPAEVPRHKVGVLIPILVLEQLRAMVDRRRPGN